ncbi:MAG: hypothetical protein LH628_12155 [Microcoleus sp. CAN_BIN18]|nr:hypothetical protein [Microcoleus sp. CAN_BIN18]
MTAKFLGWGLNPQPKNNPPKGGALNPLCFGKSWIVDFRSHSLYLCSKGIE